MISQPFATNRTQMNELSDEQRVTFLDIYACDDIDLSVSTAVIDSLVERGLVSREPDGTLNPTDLGDALYQELTGDEPYEGV